jgi:hypothetical protein
MGHLLVLNSGLKPNKDYCTRPICGQCEAARWREQNGSDGGFPGSRYSKSRFPMFRHTRMKMR